MKAETALSVIEALPDSEYKRLLNMLNVTYKPKKIKPKIGMSEAELTEYILKKLKPKK